MKPLPKQKFQLKSLCYISQTVLEKPNCSLFLTLVWEKSNKSLCHITVSPERFAHLQDLDTVTFPSCSTSFLMISGWLTSGSPPHHYSSAFPPDWKIRQSSNASMPRRCQESEKKHTSASLNCKNQRLWNAAFWQWRCARSHFLINLASVIFLSLGMTKRSEGKKREKKMLRNHWQDGCMNGA